MKTPPVGQQETLLRQISPGGDPVYFDPTRIESPVDKAVFLPSPDDSDGLSVIRNQFRSLARASRRKEKPGAKFHIASINVLELQNTARDAGFSVLSFCVNADAFDADFGEPWAHCTITEINRIDYDGNREAKIRIKEFARLVAKQITALRVISPTHLKDEPGE